MKGKFNLSSIWIWEHWRVGKLIDQWTEKNLCTDQGLNHVLSVAFVGDTQINPWYVVIFENNHTPAAGDTYAVPGFTECTTYDEANRPTWQQGGVSAKSISNSASKASFTMNAAKTIYGGALVGGGTAGSTKGDTAGGGTLYNSSQFTSGSKVMGVGEVLKVTVTLNIDDGIT